MPCSCVEPYIANAEFQPDLVAKASTACRHVLHRIESRASVHRSHGSFRCLCEYVHALYELFSARCALIEVLLLWRIIGMQCSARNVCRHTVYS